MKNGKSKMKNRFQFLMLCLAALPLGLLGCGGTPTVPETTNAGETTAEETTEAPETTASGTTRDPDSFPVLNTNAKDRGPIKYLAIGGSYNVNMTHYLYDFLKEAGYEKVEVACLYYSGATIEQQYTFMTQDSPVFRLYYNGKGNWTITEGYTMDMALRMTQWDYITFNVPNMEMAAPDKIEARLTEVMKHVRSFQPNAHFAWATNWAWQRGGEELHANYMELFDGDQMKLHNALIEGTKVIMQRHPDLEYWIPAGTAIQNMRTSKFGDEGTYLVRGDIQSHLSYDYGYYIAAMTLAKCVSDFDIQASTFIPEEYAEKFQDPELVAGLKAAVQNAVDDPWNITQNPYQ